MSPIRIVSLVSLVPLLACGAADMQVGPSSDPLEDSSVLYLTEGSFRGELVSAYTTGADELGLTGSSMVIVSELLERNGRIGSMDLSARLGPAAGTG
ncbi:MAG: hypothetical protein QGG40_14385 [Myxococcota bacterium]|nr:hypothetical protein [Myxococcota bacterium]